MGETQWLPGIVVGCAGLLLGALVLFLTRKKGPEPVADLALRDLEQRLQLLVEQLRSLDADKHQFSGEAHAQEKARLETEAASALRARDAYLQAHPEAAGAAIAGGTPRGAAAAMTAAQAGERGLDSPLPAAPPPPARAGFFESNPQLKGALWGAGIVLFFVGVGFVMMNAVSERQEGQGMTGAVPPNDPVPSAAAQLESDPIIRQAWERVKQNPQDTEASAFVAHELIRSQRFDEAQKLTDQALAGDPFHVESRIHKEVLRATRGEFREAIEALGALARTFPDAHEALLFRGALAMEVGESRLALESFERFAQQAPPSEQPRQLQQTLALLRQRVGR